MPKEFQCPRKDLGHLLKILTGFDKTERIMEEPSIDDIKELDPSASKEEIMEMYGVYLRSGIETRKIAGRSGVLNYKNTKEILKDLRKHVDNCGDCFERYMAILVGGIVESFNACEGIVSDSNFSENTRKYFKKILERKEKGLVKALKKRDKYYLKLL